MVYPQKSTGKNIEFTPNYLGLWMAEEKLNDFELKNIKHAPNSVCF
jgi:hypothetical protein